MTDRAHLTLLEEKIEQLYHDLAAKQDIRRFATELVVLVGDPTYAADVPNLLGALCRVIPPTVLTPLLEVACPKCGCEEFDIVNRLDDDGLSYREHHECTECGAYYWVWWYATGITSEESPDSQDEKEG
jgi:hypothetical protein